MVVHRGFGTCSPLSHPIFPQTVQSDHLPMNILTQLRANLAISISEQEPAWPICSFALQKEAAIIAPDIALGHCQATSSPSMRIKTAPGLQRGLGALKTCTCACGMKSTWGKTLLAFRSPAISCAVQFDGIPSQEGLSNCTSLRQPQHGLRVEPFFLRLWFGPE